MPEPEEAHPQWYELRDAFGTPVLFEVAQVAGEELFAWLVQQGADPRVCRNPDAPLPKSIPEEKKAALVSFCACLQAAIDDIPDDRLEQALRETFEEFKKSKAGPRGFVPVAQYSILRIVKSCAQK